jgi:predicted acyl esterase
MGVTMSGRVFLRSRFLWVFALIIAGIAQLPTLRADAAVHPRTVSAVTIHASVNQVYVAAPAGDTAALYNAKNVNVATGTTDAYGALVLRDLPAGSGYYLTVTAPGGAAIHYPTTNGAPSSFSILSEASINPALYKSATLHAGLNYLTMRDGISIAATVRLPFGKTSLSQGPFPTLIEYSGYNTAAPHSLIDAELGLNGAKMNDPLLPSTSTVLGALLGPMLGYAVVSIQMRGSACSGGAFDLFGATTSTDGYDAVEEIGQQSWVLHNKVGLVGISYSGISQFFIAGQRPPHLAAIAPLSPTDDLYSTGFPGGIPNNGFAAGWSNERMHDAQPAPNGQPWANAEIEAEAAMTPPVTTCSDNQLFHSQVQDVSAVEAANPARTSALYDVRSPVKRAANINVPVFLVGALHDEQTGPQWPALIAALSGNKNVWVTMQNGMHIDSLNPDVFSRMAEFLSIFVAQKVPTTPSFLVTAVLSAMCSAHQIALPATRFATDGSYQKAQADFSKDPRVRVIFDNGNNSVAGPGGMGGNYEGAFTAYPPTTAKLTNFYLGPNGTLSNTVVPTASRVSFQPNAGARFRTSMNNGGDAWAAQPAYTWQPVPSANGVAFATNPLTSNVTVVGPGTLYAMLASTATNTDLQLTISEILPKVGSATQKELYVTSGWLRASFRNTFDTAAMAKSPLYGAIFNYQPTKVVNLTPNVPAAVAIPLDPMAFTFRKGSQIRITLSAPGGDRPAWAFSALPDAGVTNTLTVGGSVKSATLRLPIVSSVVATDAAPVCGTNRGQPCRDYVAANNGR